MNNEGIMCTPAPTCVACGSNGQVVYTDLRDSLFGSPGNWSLRRCYCGLSWLDPQPRVDEIYKLYAEYYTHNSSAEGQYHGKGATAILKRTLAILFWWKQAVFQTDLFHLQGMKPGNLLEVGCGNGDFLAAAVRSGWQAFGIDFDEKAIAAARARMIPGLKAAVGDIYSHKLSDDAFDAIVMNNVIEHLPDPPRVFAACHRLLKKGGRLVMITPNIDALGLTVYGRHWRGLEIPRHLYIFNNKTLRTFAKKAGFRQITAFSSIGKYMHQASAEIAIKAGATVDVNPTKLRRKAQLLNLFGQSRGEWVVLVAEK